MVCYNWMFTGLVWKLKIYSTQRPESAVKYSSTLPLPTKIPDNLLEVTVWHTPNWRDDSSSVGGVLEKSWLVQELAAFPQSIKGRTERCFCAPITVSMRTTFQNPFHLHQSSPKSDEPTKLINYLGFDGTALPRKSARAAARAFPPAVLKLGAFTLNGSHGRLKVKSYKSISRLWLTPN